MANVKKKEVALEKLRWRCDPAELPFKTTDDIEGCEDIIGQDRALRAIKLGLEVKSPGYNIYIAGFTGTGKTTTIKRLLETIDIDAKIPDDICYVHNFVQEDMPRVLYLPPGKGCAFAQDMDDLVQELNTKLPQIFESDAFEKRRKELFDDFKNSSMELFKKLETKIRKEGFAVVKVEMGALSRPEILPLVNDEIVPFEKLRLQVTKGELSEEKFQQLMEKHDSLSADLEKTLRENRTLEKESYKRLDELTHRFCMPVVKSFVYDLKEKYPHDGVTEYLDQVQNHILQNLDRFQDKEDKKSQLMALPTPQPDATMAFQEYSVNVVVDNSNLNHIPVIIETAPSYRNLFGTIERVVDRNGVAHTDFSRIKSGSLLKANGGYLVFNLVDAIVEPGVWVALKRTLKNRKLDIQAYDPYFYSTFALKPEAVDLDIKVVVIGDASLYQLLYSYDEDFKKIFKVKADFDTVMTRDGKAMHNYARVIKKLCDDEDLKPFSNTAIAQIIEHGVRLAGRQNKISTRFSDIADLMREADYWSRKNGSKIISDSDIRKAIDEKIYRSSMAEEKIQEMIDEGVLMIDIDGSKVGQVNGLSVYDLGDYRFGRPSKITAEIGLGKEGIINIEREADLSGKTHNKGVLILSGYLRGKYAREKPLTLSASLAFEQSYSGVDGDSASSTEIYALLSELSELPLRQDIAVTGSVNQKGEIQPIGGVNEKIEGFFDVCKAKGLTGEQGVLIPHQNVADLMLKPELTEAVKSGTFHVYSVRTIDEGIELLTGVAAGEKRDDGTYPEKSVNQRVDQRLKELAHGLKVFQTKEVI